MIEPADIQIAASRLAAGGLVAFPTETVYGLGADATNAEAVAGVFAAKGRPASNPLIVHVTDDTMAMNCVADWPEIASKAAAAFWPGPLTLVLPRAATIPGIVTGDGETVAVRAPDHAVALALIRVFDKPIVGPSANPSGYVSPTTAPHVRAHFDEDTVLVLDGGTCRAGIESTVLDLTGAVPRILRRGVLGSEELTPVLGPVEIVNYAPRDGNPVHSPGLLGPHYRPRARVMLLDDISQLAAALAEARGKVALLSPPGERVRVPRPHVGVDMPGIAPEYARALYASLRDADHCEPERILVVFPQRHDSEIWDAVRDRLRRSAAE